MWKYCENVTWKYSEISLNPSPTDDLFFSCKTTCPPQICRAAIYSILISRLLLILSSSAKSPTVGPNIKISKIRYGASGISILSTSASIDSISLSTHLILIFFFFCSWRKSLSSFFQKNGLSVSFHTAPVLLCRRRKLLILPFQNYDLNFFFFLIFKKIIKQSKRVFCAIYIYFFCWIEELDNGNWWSSRGD